MPGLGDMTAEEMIDRSASPREMVVKAYEIGFDRSADEKDALEKADQLSTDGPSSASAIGHIGMFVSDAVDPPYNPDTLCKLYEHSSSLRQNVTAYATNIDGFGHAFEPVVQLKESGARDLVSDALYLEKSQAVDAGMPGAELVANLPPTDLEINTKVEELRYAMRVEHAKIESFFDSCVSDESFTSLRRKTREDVEVTGNGYWEVIRNDAGVVSQFAHMPSRSVRVCEKKSAAVGVTQQVRVGLLAFRSESYKRKFRRYVQAGGDATIYFKEFGDPLTVSSKTGVAYTTPDELGVAEPGIVAANEVFHFKIHSLKNGAYGVPRWIGSLLSVLGSRSAEEVNLAYFDNKSIPPMAILVSGGRLGEESVKRIENFVEVQIKGKRNFHKILVIEAETTAGAIGLGADNAGAMRVEIKTLTDAQLKDGLFLQYDSANLDKVGMTFRLPRMLRGDIRDFNRASAEAALDFAESQVFVPERNDFDFAMNRFILPELGIRYFKFKSHGPRLSDSQSWGDMIVKLTNAGILTPGDARDLTSKKVLSQELPILKADWTTQPLSLTIAGVQADSILDGVIPLPNAGFGGGAPPPPDPNAPPADSRLVPPPDALPAPGVIPDQSLVMAAKNRLMRTAKDLVRLRDAFRAQEATDAVKRYKADRIEEGEEVFMMTSREMQERFGLIPNKLK